MPNIYLSIIFVQFFINTLTY